MFVCMRFVSVSTSYTQLKVCENEQVVVDVVLQSLQWQRGTSWLDLGPYNLHTFNKKPQGCNYVPSYPLVLR